MSCSRLLLVILSFSLFIPVTAKADQCKNIARAFSSLDRNSDGIVDESEVERFKLAIQALQIGERSRTQNLAKIYDSNKDGVFNLGDLGPLNAAISGGNPCESNQMAAFSVVDTNSNGVLETAEWLIAYRKAVELSRLQRSNSRVADLFPEFDLNEDGSIDVKDLLILVNTYRKLRG